MNDTNQPASPAVPAKALPLHDPRGDTQCWNCLHFRDNTDGGPCDGCLHPGWANFKGVREELARLTAERDAYKATVYDELGENMRLRELGDAGPDEGITAMTERVIRERDTLRVDLGDALAEFAAARDEVISLDRQRGTLLDAVEKLTAERDTLAQTVHMLRADADKMRGQLDAPLAQKPAARVVRNGLVDVAVAPSKRDAEEHAEMLQRSHDLSGSLAAFRVYPLAQMSQEGAQ